MQPAMLRGFHLLVTKFLEHDTEVRVSVRALAMQCVTQLIHIHPQLFFHIVDTIIDTDSKLYNNSVQFILHPKKV